MSTVAAVPFVMKDCLLTIGSDSYQAAITRVQFTPSTNVQTVRALAPAAVYTDQDQPSWVLDLEWLQDWATVGNFGKYLLDNAGDAVSCTFEPITGGATITATVLLSPGPIGGPAGSFATASVSLGVQGQPSVGA